MAVTYGDLQARIQREVNRPASKNVDPIKDAIISAIRFFRHKNFWFTQKNGTVTLSDTSTSATLPTDFLSMINLRIVRGTTIYGRDNGFTGVTLQELNDYIFTSPAWSGRPTQWALQNANILFNATADDDYTLLIDYHYKDAAEPVADGDTSLWFEEFVVDMVRYKALEIFYRDYLHAEERAQWYLQKSVEFENNLREKNNVRQGRVRLNTGGGKNNKIDWRNS